MNRPSHRHQTRLSTVLARGAAVLVCLLSAGMTVPAAGTQAGRATLQQSEPGDQGDRLAYRGAKDNRGSLLQTLVKETAPRDARKGSTAPIMESITLYGLPWLLLMSVALLGGLGMLAWSGRQRRARILALQQQNLQFNAVLASVNDGIIITDSADKVVTLNRVAEILTGWMQADARGRRLDAIFALRDEQTRERLTLPAPDRMPQDAFHGRLERSVLVARNGAERPVECCVTASREANGSLAGRVVAFRDMSKDRQSEQESRRFDQTLETRLAERTEALRQTRDDWVNAFDAVPDLVAIIGKDGTIIRANHALAARLEQVPDALVGKPYQTCLYKASQPPEGCPYTEMLRDGQAHASVMNLEHLGGPVEVEVVPMRNESGGATESVLIARDLSAQKQREAEYEDRLRQLEATVSDSGRALQAARAAATPLEAEAAEQQRRADQVRARMEALKEDYQRVLHAALDGFFIVNARDGRFIDVNDAYCDMTGYTRDELLRKRLLEVEAGESPVELARRLQRVGDTGMDTRETRHRRKDGGLIEVAVRFQYVALQDGLLMAFVKDLTERKRDVATLRRKSEEMDKFFSLALDLLCIADTDGYFRLLNQAWENVLGYSREELMAGTFLNLIHPDDLPDTLAAIEELAAQKPVFGFVNRYRCKDGSYRWLEWHASPVDKVVYATARDITAHREIQDSLEQARQAAEGSSKAKSDFLASMSHELRTPLNAVIGFSEILVDGTFGELNSKQEKYVCNVLDSGRRLLSLINNILDLSRVETGKMEIDFTPLPVKQLLEDSLGMLREKLPRNGLCVHVDAPEDLIATVDEQKMKRVLFNLLNNAAKFSPNGGDIDVSVKLAEKNGGAQYIEFSVSDSGIGIRPEDQGRLFRPFEQLDSGPYRAHQGAGLGLALSRNFVEMHGGHIWAESDGEGKGATFRFVIPAAQGH